MKTLFLTVANLLVFSALAQHSVGHFSKTFVDPSRNNRDILTEVYYPATSAGDNTPVASGEFPVIVFGHGFVMAWDAYENLWEAFVPEGYIMVFPRTEGSLASTNHQEFGWDLQFLVTELQNEGALASSDIYQAVSPETALMGHSMGGGAAFLAADSLCSNGNTNLRTLIGLAPAESSTNGVSSIASAANVTVPSLILSGIQDGVTPPNDHHIPMYSALAATCKTILNIIGGAHCYFANTNLACDFGELTASSGISISRTEQQDVTNDFVKLWLDYNLKYNCESYTVFQDSVSNSTRVTYSQVCLFSVPTINTTIAETAAQLSSNENAASAYQWLDCNNGYAPISNETSQIFTPAIDGSYAVQITVNGCRDTSACVDFTSSLSLIEQLNNHIQIHPNPANEAIVFGISSSMLFNVAITDIHGKILVNEENVGNGSKVDIQYLEAGSYFITFTIENERITKKLIKQ